MLQPSPLPQPVLSVALPAIEDVKGGEGLSSLWHVFSKCKEFTQDGSRLENISWRLWYRHLHPPGSSYGHCEDYPEGNFEQHRRLSVSSGSSLAESSEASTSGSFEETSNASHQQQPASPVSTLLHHQVEAARNASPHLHSSTTSATAHPRSRRLQSRPSSSVSIQSEPSYFPSNRAGGDLSMTTNTPANGHSSSNRDEGSGSTTPRPPLGARGYSSPHFAAHGTASHGSGSTTPHATRHHHPRQHDDAPLSFGRVLGQVFREGMSTAGSREMVVERERQRERTRTRSMEIKANMGGLAQHQGTSRCNPTSAVSSPNIVMTASPAVPPSASSSASLTLRAARAVVAREKEPLEDEDENERYLISGPSIHVTDPTPFNTQPNTPETSQRGTPTGPMSPETATMTLRSRAEAENSSSSSTRAGVTSPLATTTTAPLSSPSLHSNSSLASGSSEHIDQRGSLVDSIGTCSSAESALAFTSKRPPQPQQQQQTSQPQPSPSPKLSSPTPSQRDQASSAAAALKRSMFFIQSPGDGGDGASSSSMASSGGAAAPCGYGGGGVAAAGAGSDCEGRRIVAGGLGLGMDGHQHNQGAQKQQPQPHPTTTTNKGKGKASSTTTIVSPRNSATGRVRSPISPPSPNSSGRRLSLSAHHPTGRPSEPSPSFSPGVGRSPVSPTTSAHLEVSPHSPAGHHLPTAPSPLKHGSSSSAAAPTTAAATTTLKPAAIESRHRRRSSASSAGIGLKHTIKSQAVTAAKLKRTPSSTNANNVNPNSKKVLSTTTIGIHSAPASKSPDARGSSTFGKRPALASQTSNMSTMTATSAHKSRSAGPSAAPTTLAMTKASSHKSAGGVARPGPGASFAAAEDGNSDGYEDVDSGEDESEFDSDEEMDSDEIDDDQEEDDSDDWASDSDDASALAQLAEERAARERAEEAERQRTMFQKVPTSKSQMNLYGLGREAAVAKPSPGGSGASADGLKRMTSSHSSVDATTGSAGEGPTGNIGGGRSSGLLSDMFRIEREKREAAQAALASPPLPPVTTVDQQQPPTLARPRRNSSSQDLWVRTRSGLAMTTGLATATTSATMAGAGGLTRNKSSAALPLENGLSVGREPMVSIPQHRQSGPKGEELETDSEDEGQGVPNKLALEASEAQRRLALLSAKRSPSNISPNGGGSQTQSRLPSGDQKHQQHPPTTRPLPPRPKSPSPLPSSGPVETAGPSAAHAGEPEPPIMGIPQSPRTTRRQMLAAELPEELRKQLLWERMSRQVVGPAAPTVAAHLNRSNSSPRLSQEGSTGISSAGSRPTVSRGATAPASEGNSRANSPHPSPPDATTSTTTGNANGKTTPPAPSLAKRATTSLLASAGLRPLTPSGPPSSGVAQSTTATQPLDGRPGHHHAVSTSSTVSSASSSRANSRGPPNVHGGPMRRTKSKVYLPTHVYPDQIISHGMGALRAKMEERKAKKAAGADGDSSSSDEEDEELEAQIALQRSRTHTGALNYMIPDDDRTWDADYRSHGF